MNHKLMLGVAGVVLASAGNASGDYVVDIRSGGASVVQAFPGQTVEIEVILQSASGDTHTSAITRLVFSLPGLSMTSAEWAPPYETGGIFDDSAPALVDLPSVLTAGLLAGPGYPVGVVDLELANVIASGSFGVGVLVSLTVEVPLDAVGAIEVWAEPDTFANGFAVIPAQSGSSLSIQVVPSPGTGVPACVVGAAIALRRRRPAR